MGGGQQVDAIMRVQIKGIAKTDKFQEIQAAFALLNFSDPSVGNFKPAGEFAHGEAAVGACGFHPLDQQAIGIGLNRFLHFGKVYEVAVVVPKSGTAG